MIASKIEWCDFTWNPITGCLNGCAYCYASKMAHRLKGRYGYPADDPFRPTFHPEALDKIESLAGKGKILPEMGWILDLVHRAEEASIPVFLKDNIGTETAYHFGPEFQQFPEDLA